jgi:hypothetical protein
LMKVSRNRAKVTIIRIRFITNLQGSVLPLPT